jgi:hypothetical protein
MKRVTKLQQSIIQAHIYAKQNNSFKEIKVSTIPEMRQALLDGYTFEQLYNEVEIRYTSIVGILINSNFRHLSKNYKSGITKGFKVIFTTLNIE